MSGPATDADDPAIPGADDAVAGELQIIEGRTAEVGGFGVRRMLPVRPRRTVGAWCFVDHMGPGTVTAGHGLDVGPHPHIGLQTVTWLVRGAILHRDSLGSEQLIRPGQLNLMTAGHGVSHAEETSGVHSGEVHGVQLWVAQPTATRDGDPAFEHHGELPRVELRGATAIVLVGSLLDVASPARRDTDHLGVELTLRAGPTVVPLRREHEHAVVVLEGSVAVGKHVIEPGHLGYLGPGRDELPIHAAGAARVLVLGGTPFPERPLMWWNYVARTRDEITEAHRAWTAADPRFGTVRTALARIDVAPPPWATL